MIPHRLRKLFAPLAIIACVFPALAAHATNIRHVRVIWQENPAQESYVAWTTKGLLSKKNNTVYFDTVSRAGKYKNYRYSAKTFKDGLYYMGTSHVHGAKLTNLTPSTRYYFVVRSNDTLSKEYNFITAPTGKDASFKMLVGGDSRSDRDMRQKINRKLAGMLEANPEILALNHGGDYVSIGFKWGDWKDWLEDYELTTTQSGRVLPIIPTRGNHELSNKLFDHVFMYPGGRVSNYYLSRIAGLSLIVLDSEKSVAGDQKDWLAKVLEEESRTARYVVPNYHTPAYPAVKEPSEALQHWVPLFEKHGVSLAFESDGHVLKRTAPIFQGKVDHERGITYVGEGGLGVKLREASKAKAWYFQAPGYAASEYHVFMMDVTPERMKLDVVLMDGRIFDTMTFFPRAR